MVSETTLLWDTFMSERSMNERSNGVHRILRMKKIQISHDSYLT